MIAKTTEKHIVIIFSVLCILLVLSFASSHAAKPSLKGKVYTYIAKNNQKFKMYVSGPESASKGVLLIHEWWGLNHDMKVWADRYASLGYRAAAIDLYSGKVTTDPKQAKKLMNSVKQKNANAKYQAALQALRTPDKNRRVAVIGWSFGGAQALQAALVAPDLVSATIMYYPFGKMEHGKERLSAMGGPVLGNLAKHDFAFTPDKVKKFQSAMKQAGKVFKIHMVDAKHGFDKPAGKHYNKKASDQAWVASKQFLKEHLK